MSEAEQRRAQFIARVLARSKPLPVEERERLVSLLRRYPSDRQHTSGPNDPTHETDEG